jgi:hypothetical protein
MAKQRGSGMVLQLLAWFTGVVVSLAVGFAMTGNGALNQSIPWLSDLGGGVIVAFVGWVVVITTLVSAVMALLRK